MSNQPFDRVIINTRERPVSEDINRAQSQLDRELRDLLERALGIRGLGGVSYAGSTPTGFLADGFFVESTGAMALSVRAGIGVQNGTSDVPTDIGSVLGVDDRSRLKPLYLADAQALTVPAADATNPRIDIVQVRYNRVVGAPATRGVLNLVTGVFDPTLVQKCLTFALDGLTSFDASAPIDYKAGTPAGSPVAPTVTAGYVKIAEVRVPASASSLDASNVADFRPLAAPGGVLSVRASASFPTSTNGAPTFLNAIAPPGVRVVAVTQGSGLKYVRFYVFAGKHANSNGVLALQPRGDYSAIVTTPPDAFILRTTLAVGTVDGALQTALAGAQAFPAAAISIGQPFIQLNVYPVRATDGAQTNLPDPLVVQVGFDISLSV